MTSSFSENAEVSAVETFVAVAVTSRPNPASRVSHWKGVLPRGPVDLLVVSRSTAPSPWPEASGWSSARKHWIRKHSSGVLLRVPVMVVKPVVELLVAEVMVGKFWRLFSPVSGSSASLFVTPSALRSMPRPSLSKMELERKLLPVEERKKMSMPSAPLPEMVLAAPGSVPPPCCRAR